MSDDLFKNAGDPITEPEFVTQASDSPTVYADVLYHVSWLNGVMRLTFAQSVAEPSGKPNAGWHGKHVATVAMPALHLPATIKYLQQTLENMKKDGAVFPDAE